VLIPALTGPIFAQAWGDFVQFPGEDGQPLGARPSYLLVGPLDFDAAINIAYMEKPSGGAGGGNTYRGRVQVIFVPEWGDGTCMLIDANSPLTRAFIFQEREPNRVFPLWTSPTDSMALHFGYLKWLLQGRYEVGIGQFRCAYRMGRAAP
jgi:phage major head subunit gpT-like protein